MELQQLWSIVSRPSHPATTEAVLFRRNTYLAYFTVNLPHGGLSQPDCTGLVLIGQIAMPKAGHSALSMTL